MNQNKASSLLDEEKRLYIIAIYLETALYSCALVYGILHLPLCWNPAERRKHNQVGPTTDMSSDNRQKEKVSFGSNEAMMINFKTDEM
ncbi:hypothetical protein AOXY_G956 [Acipenser oxyrinchus oxyrinchus]|uniref:Uncharacterized protein n=1 Tax=Acipenser oxyrinchus oxyrinchus TaxID=40147 RepID=A0AAD8GL04_ACIOX|nr:hypothetical protein AOXY_G38802 [Acipenser oxyrinchus oxyrinchus]KAK1176135.1 hypothetical protein AOXY_G956 [Acipenser oxyrinchus oxyrinchus]